MRILVIRHAESTANADGRISGTGDPELSPRGIHQAEAVSEAIATISKKRPVASIYTSRSRRAAMTASAIAANLPGSEVISVEALREMDYGDWEGMRFNDLGDPVHILRQFENSDFAPPGGECVNDLFSRVSSWIERDANTIGDKTVVVVTHLGPTKALAIWALMADLSLFPRLRISNASITQIAVSSTSRFLLSLNEHAEM